MTTRKVLLMLGALCISSCAAMPLGADDRTAGERFRAGVAQLDAACKRESTRLNETSCRMLRLEPRDFDNAKLVKVEGQPLPVPEQWVATEEGRFAHSIRLPNPLPVDSGYRQGMDPVEYFKHLCMAEAGEFIYVKTKKVEGVMQLRRRGFMGDDEMNHLYFMEDPYGQVGNQGDASLEFFFVNRFRYLFFERAAVDESSVPKWARSQRHSSRFAKPSANQKVERFTRVPTESAASTDLHKEFDVVPRSAYGFTWRGIRRTNDRELGIAGGELIVLDLRTQTVLGVRRGYFLGSRTVQPPHLTGTSWLTGTACPEYKFPGKPGYNRYSDFEYWFVREVLEPINLVRPEPYLDRWGG